MYHCVIRVYLSVFYICQIPIETPPSPGGQKAGLASGLGGIAWLWLAWVAVPVVAFAVLHLVSEPSSARSAACLVALLGR